MTKNTFIPRFITTSLFVLIYFLFSRQEATALMCYPSRVINQWRCGWDTISTKTCADADYTCVGDPTDPQYARSFEEKYLCDAACDQGPYSSSCSEYCATWNAATKGVCQVESFIGGCTPAPDCQFAGTVYSCYTQGDNCIESTSNLYYGCWGPGGDPPECGDGNCDSTESCSSCVADCGACGWCGDGSCRSWEGEVCDGCIPDCGTCSNPFCGDGNCGNSPGEACDACVADCGVCNPPTQYCGDGSCNGGETNCTCSEDCGICPTPPPTPTPTPVNSILNGQVYLDPNRQASGNLGSNCTLAGATAFTPGGANSSTVTTNSQTHPIKSNGAYDLFVLPSGDYNVTIAPESPYYCTCPVGCTYGITVPPNSIRDFYISDTSGPWFQTQGGDIHAENGGASFAFKNDPPPCAAPCQSYTSIKDAFNTNTSTGILSYSNGNIDYGTSFDSEGRGRLAHTNTNITQENYEYFYRLFELPETPTDDLAAVASNAPKPAYDSNKKYFFRNGDLTINTQWDLIAGESYVIFISGDLFVNQRIVVPVGGFLSFIVHGQIVFSETVGRANHTRTDSVVDGVFISNDTISINATLDPVTELKFVGSGSFISHNGIRLLRDFKNSDNNTLPTELFIFRPDFVINAPDEFKKPLYTWKQVAP